MHHNGEHLFVGVALGAAMAGGSDLIPPIPPTFDIQLSITTLPCNSLSFSAYANDICATVRASVFLFVVIDCALSIRCK